MTRGGHHVQDARAAHGQGPRLVQQEGAGPAQVLQCSTVPDDHTAARGTGETGDDGDRGGQQQGAGGGDHQNGDRAHRGATDQPRQCRRGEGQRKEPGSIAVRQPHHWRRFRAGLLGEPHDAGVGAVLFGGGGAQVERAAGVDRAAACHLTPVPRGLEWFTGEYRLVEDRFGAFDAAVDRDDLTRADDQCVPGSDLSQRHPDHVVVGATACRARGVREQGVQVVGGAALSSFLQSAARGQHERDQGPGQVLTDGQGAPEREYGDQVHARVPATECDQYPAHRGDEGGHGAQPPEEVRQAGGVEEMGDAPTHQSRSRDNEEAVLESGGCERRRRAAHSRDEEEAVHGHLGPCGASTSFRSFHGSAARPPGRVTIGPSQGRSDVVGRQPGSM